MELELNNLQKLIRHKTQTNKQTSKSMKPDEMHPRILKYLSSNESLSLK